jgi:hypothetical protein
VSSVRNILLALTALAAMTCGACVLALSTADVARLHDVEANSAYVYRSDASTPTDQLLAKANYCLAWATLTDNAEDAGDAGIICPPEAGR